MSTVYPALWYTSNTVQVAGRHCPMERYLGFHAGPAGCGYRRKSTSVPLATGAAVHAGLQLVGEWILEWQDQHAGQVLLDLPTEVVAWAAQTAAQQYEHTATTRGLELTKGDLTAEAAVRTLILEQRTLIEAQVWIYALVRLPYMLSQYRLLAVEHEETPILDCTCGLGNWMGDAAMHAARGCTGIVDQGRADFLWQTRDLSGHGVYEEFKTKATPNYGWEQQWEDSGQLLLNMEAASRRSGIEFNEAFVPVLYKGKRDRTNRDDKTSPKIQQTPLVYGWFDPGGLNRPPEWSARYKWWDDYGKGHTLPRTYQRTPIWTAELPPAPNNPNGVTAFTADASVVEQWVRGWILPIQWTEFLQTLGPFPRPRQRLPLAEAAILAEERRWREDVEWLREQGAVDAQHPAVIEIIPRSWSCHNFDGSKCQFHPICHQEPGYESMEQIGYYEVRTPHHVPERQAYEQLGVVFPEVVGDDDGGGDE